MAYDSDFKSHLSYSKMEKAFREAKKSFCNHTITPEKSVHHKEYVECYCSKCGKKFELSERHYGLYTGMVSISDNGVMKRDIYLTMKDEYYRRKLVEHVEDIKKLL